MIFLRPDNLKDEDIIVEILEDDIILYVDKIDVDGMDAIFTGTALIDDEKYKDFEVEVTFLETANDKSFEEILELEWDSYDIVF